jgi:hypothetical protein
MTAPKPLRAAPRRRGPLIMVAASLLPMVSACAGAVHVVHLPARQIVTSAPVVAPTVPSPTEQAAAALIGYVRALGQADKSRRASAARQLLRPYLAPSRISGLVQAMSAIWAKGETFYGEDVVHVSGVTVGGDGAFVHDCDNTSGLGLMDLATHEIVPGSTGVPQDNLITRLDLVGGHWLVQYQLVEELPCMP